MHPCHYGHKAARCQAPRDCVALQIIAYPSTWGLMVQGAVCNETKRSYGLVVMAVALGHQLSARRISPAPDFTGLVWASAGGHSVAQACHTARPSSAHRVPCSRQLPRSGGVNATVYVCQWLRRTPRRAHVGACTRASASTRRALRQHCRARAIQEGAERDNVPRGRGTQVSVRRRVGTPPLQGRQEHAAVALSTAAG